MWRHRRRREGQVGELGWARRWLPGSGGAAELLEAQKAVAAWWPVLD